MQSPDVEDEYRTMHLEGSVDFDFQILPFRFLPLWVKWQYAVFANEDYGSTLYETVEDVDNDDVGIFYYGAILSDGGWIVHENFFAVQNELLFVELEAD